MSWFKKNRKEKCNFSDPTKNFECTEFEVNNWTLSDFIVNHLIPIVGMHPFPLNEMLLMSGAICWLKPTHLFEWGTHIGKSARIFDECCTVFSLNTKIHSIDLPDDVEHIEHPGEKRGHHVKGRKNVTLHQGDGLDIAMELARSIDNPSSFLFFVDGDHSFESVSRELKEIGISFPSASVLLHDTFFQSSEAGYNTGPHEAVQIAIKDHFDSHKIVKTNTGLPGMTLIYNCNKIE